MKKSMLAARSLVISLLLVSLSVGFARGEQSWQAEFDDTCSKTDQAMTLPVEEVSRLLESCDRLQGVIATKEETVRKVYLKRLQMCRNLYQFVLDTRKAKQGQPG
jgi:hypothetical protein